MFCWNRRYEIPRCTTHPSLCDVWVTLANEEKEAVSYIAVGRLISRPEEHYRQEANVLPSHFLIPAGLI